MSITKANDPAMPTTDTYLGDGNVPITRTLSTGLTKREMIAMHLYSAFLAALPPTESLKNCVDNAECAVQCADALINELNRTAKP